MDKLELILQIQDLTIDQLQQIIQFHGGINTSLGINLTVDTLAEILLYKDTLTIYETETTKIIKGKFDRFDLIQKKTNRIVQAASDIRKCLELSSFW